MSRPTRVQVIRKVLKGFPKLRVVSTRKFDTWYSDVVIEFASNSVGLGYKTMGTRCQQFTTKTNRLVFQKLQRAICKALRVKTYVVRTQQGTLSMWYYPHGYENCGPPKIYVDLKGASNG